MEEIWGFILGQKFGFGFALLTFLYSYFSGKNTERKNEMKLDDIKKENKELHHVNISLTQKIHSTNSEINKKIDIDKEIESSNIESIFKKIKLLQTNGNKDLAELFYNRLALNDSVIKSSDYWLNLGETQILNGDNTLGLMYFKKAEEFDLNGSNYLLYTALGIFYLKEHDYFTSKNYINAALSTNKNHNQALVINAYLEFASGNNEETSRICEILNSQNFKSSQFFNLQGQIAIVNNDYNQAILHFKDAINSDKKNEIPFLNLVGCYIIVNDLKKALEIIDIGYNQNPNSKYLLLQKGYVFMRQEKIFDALALYENELEYTMGNMMTLSNYVYCLFATGSSEKVTQLANKMEKENNLPGIDKYTPIASDILNSAVDINSNPLNNHINFLHSNYFTIVGNCYSGLKNIEMAVYYYKKALFISPNDKTYNNIAKLYIDNLTTENIKVAEFYISEGLFLNPQNPELHNNKGYLNFLINKLDDAKADFEIALQIDPNYQIAKENLLKIIQMNS